MSPSEVATRYLGKTEKPANSGFTDAEFERRMKEVGWLRGQAWCACYVELVFKEAYPDKAKKLDAYFSASAVQTFKNFQAAGFKISKTPIKDSIVIWQTQKSGKPHWSGHAGVCVEVVDNTAFKSIEGNTNAEGGREGMIVAKKLRTIKPVKNGLQVMGFIVLQ
jgi:hypothetical protein